MLFVTVSTVPNRRPLWQPHEQGAKKKHKKKVGKKEEAKVYLMKHNTLYKTGFTKKRKNENKSQDTFQYYPTTSLIT
jgi:hypothetical protein